METTVAVGDILVGISVLVLVWQTYLLRKEIEQQLVQELYGRWGKATELEVKYPSFHKMVVSKQVLMAIKKLSRSELRDRALAWYVFDTVAPIWRQTRPGWWKRGWEKVVRVIKKKDGLEFHDEVSLGIERMMTNPNLQKAWCDWRLREEYKGTEFQVFVDEMIAKQNK